MMEKTLGTLRILSIAMTLVLPLVMVFKHQFSKNKRLQSWQMFIIGIITVWLLIQIDVYFTNAYLRAELDAFDLDGNGFFTSEEINEAQRAAMMRVTSDTGRALAPITGAIFALGYMSMLVILSKLISFFVKVKPSSKD